MATQLLVTLNDTDWHKVGTPLEQLCIKSIAGNSLELCCTDETSIPTENTKAYMYIGGIVNDIKTRPNYQNWIRATATPSIFMQHDVTDEGFDELSGIRMSIAGLQNNVMLLNNRVIDLEIWRANTVEDINYLTYTINRRIDYVFKNIAGLINNDILLTNQIYETRKKFPTIMNLISDIEATKVDKTIFDRSIADVSKMAISNTNILLKLIQKTLNIEDKVRINEAGITNLNNIIDMDTVNTNIENMMLMITKNSNIDLITAARLIDLDNKIQLCNDKLISLINDTSDAEYTDLKTRITALQNGMNMYWELCLTMANATTAEAITNIYSNFVTEHMPDSDMLAILTYAYNQALTNLANQ